MIQKSGDFGALGEGELQTVQTVANTTQSVKAASGGGGGDGGGGCLGSCCSSSKSRDNAKVAKQAEAQVAIPAPTDPATGMPIPKDSPKCDAACKEAYAKQEAYVAEWEKGQDLKDSLSLPSNVKEGMAFASEIGEKLKEKLPASAGGMSLAQIYDKFPKEAAEAFDLVGKRYPAVGAIPPKLLMAMSPSIANSTLDYTIERSQRLSGKPSMISKVPGGAATVGGLVGLLGLGAFFIFRKK